MSSERWLRIKRESKNILKVETSPKNRLGSNLSAPLTYPVQEVADGEYTFLAESGKEYIVYFTEGDGYLPGKPFSSSIRMFGFDRSNRVRSRLGSDIRILQTVIQILTWAFEATPDLIVIYMCSQSGGLQRHRNSMFEALFKQFGEGYRKINYNLEEIFFCSAIFREDHQFLKEIENSIQLFIQDKQFPVW